MVLDLRRAGGILTEGGVEIGGWRIESTHGHMSGEAELEDIKEKLGGVMRIPEIVFGQNTLQVQHLATGLTIRFNTVDALKAWAVAKRPPLQLDVAEQWKRSRECDIERHGAQQLQYDWTFTSTYNGTYLPSDVEGAFVDCAAGLDRDVLSSKADPVLFYDALCLYESELDDRGICTSKVQIRVMPTYWFLALRFFLRVDHHLVRLYETRLFASYPGCRALEARRGFWCRFASGAGVVREVKQWEATFEELRSAGAPFDMLSYRDAETAAAQLSSIGLIFDRSQQIVRYKDSS